MYRKLFLLTCLLSSFVLFAQYPTATAYIDRYKLIAISEMQRTGIPASIKLGQAILESAAGESKLAVKANNHFGVKCGSIWNGDTYGLKDDERAFLFFKKKSCFRKYNNAEESYIDHSEFIRRPNGPYQSLFSLPRTDYKAWAYGLKKAGYATAADYPQKLISVIERYQLYQFDGATGPITYNPDTPIPSSTPAAPKKQSAPLFEKETKPIRINMVKAFIAKGGEKVEDVAAIYKTPVAYVMKYNSYISSGEQLLKQNDIVYFQKKKKSFWGKKKTYMVLTNQNMFDISQQFGVREDKLRERNGISEGTEPIAGQIIYLRGHKPKDSTIKTRAADEIQIKVEQKPTKIFQDTVTTNTKPIINSIPVENSRPVESTFPVENIRPIEKAKPVDNPKTMDNSSDLLDFYIEPKEKKLDTIAISSQSDSINYKPVLTGVKFENAKPSTIPDSNNTVVTPLPETKSDIETQKAATVGNLPFPSKETTDKTLISIKYYVVDIGDTLYNISKRYGISVAKLKELNQLASDNISLGQKLNVGNE